MEDRKIRELPVKQSGLRLTDQFIVEDNDGTKIADLALLASLVYSANCFNTVNDMKNANFKEGDIVTTLGYNDVNDGGGATYKITYAPTDLDDGVFVHYLHTSDTLRAHLLHGGDINVLQAGAAGDGVNDDIRALMKAINSKYPITFPKRTYHISAPLEIPDNTIIDLNGSTLRSTGQACIIVNASNVKICNGIFEGYVGISIGSSCKNVTIQDCTFTSNKDIDMYNGIVINGANDITVSNCTIGHADDKVTIGVHVKGDSSSNNNVLISNNIITVSQYGIDMQSVQTDKNIIISSNIIIGNKFKTGDSTGINVSSGCRSGVISECSISNMSMGISLNSLLDCEMSLTNITADTTVMYNISNTHVTAYFNGNHRFIPSTAVGVALFENVYGTIYIAGTFCVDSLGSSIAQAKGLITGTLRDHCEPYLKPQITIPRATDLTSNMLNIVPGFMNVSLNLAYSGNVSRLPFPSMNGQFVALYSTEGAVLTPSSTITIAENTPLDKYTPVILKNNNGIWTRCA